MTCTFIVEWMLTGSMPIVNSFRSVGMVIELVADDAVKLPRRSIVPAVGITSPLVLMMIFLGVSLLSSPRLILMRAISGRKVKLTGSTVESSLISNGVSQTFVYMKS